ncbi:PDZ domain-containing protein [Jatrophihabitans telluris]|uniref:endopeptidase La n=1 Tax=Jatrophihabitans telluris TaxID=2038343 RepID=A0ABY4R1N9_9ACTN|nr:S16 family serine protease [Jatrophihabitans telluris]UQX89735.1 PDZ domain-containing protein [Jatrophihabitans telluris]
MSRQLRTLLVGVVLIIALGGALFLLRVPYVVMSPGPTVNTLGRDNGADIISIQGHAVAKTSGSLNLTTVSVETQDTTVAGALRGWLAHDEVVVPHDSIYPPGQTQQQTDAQDKQDFIESQDAAVAAAACYLKYPRGFGVSSVSDTSPNKGVLKPGDVFESLNGTKVSDDTGLLAVLKTLKPGDSVPALVLRNGIETTLKLTLGAAAAGSTTPRLGIALTSGCLPPFNIALGLSGIGGPSAGLMFALGIVDKLGTDDLTHGKIVAGTGTIDAQGNVGQIGGIQLKMLGAKRDGASVFLAPSSNCPDVRGNVPSGLTVIKVSTMTDAINELDAYAAGKTDLPHC